MTSQLWKHVIKEESREQRAESREQRTESRVDRDRQLWKTCDRVGVAFPYGPRRERAEAVRVARMSFDGDGGSHFNFLASVVGAVLARAEIRKGSASDSAHPKLARR